jgi:hypothetical protein
MALWPDNPFPDNPFSNLQHMEVAANTIIVLLQQIAADTAAIKKALVGDAVTGINVIPGPVTHSQGAKMATVRLMNKCPARTLAKAGPGKATVDFQFIDNGDSTCSVTGMDLAGNVVDISSVATITAVSSDITKITVAPPVGMTFKMSAVGR